jgi:hypothetical protein
MMYDDLKVLLQGSGLVTAYTFQAVFNDQSWDAAKRYCVIRFAGGRGDVYERNAAMQIHFLGKVNTCY